MSKVTFTISQKDKKTNARTGEIRTPHGVVRTPNFCAVGTQGTVKALDGQDLHNIGLDIVLANTYHLHIRPGEDVIDAHGGLAAMMNWNFFDCLQLATSKLTGPAVPLPPPWPLSFRPV